MKGLPTGVKKVLGNRKRPFLACIQFGGKSYILGYFTSPEEAGRAYKEAREKIPRLTNLTGDLYSRRHSSKLADLKKEVIETLIRNPEITLPHEPIKRYDWDKTAPDENWMED